MDTIIGLGKAGCAIAEKFSQYPQYNIYKIDSEGLDKKEPNCYLLKREESPEKYETQIPSLKTFFKSVTDDILFVVSGSGIISGASLRALQQLSDKNINVLYIKPDLKFLGKINIAQERLVRNVLQEYARSGVIERIYLVDNKIVEEILGEIPIVGYYDKLNDLIVSIIHMINVYNHQTPIHETSFISHDTTRISTFGIVDIQDGEEKLFFLLDNVCEKSYYYAINSETLETDGKLLRKLTDNINSNISEEILAGFQVHSTSYKDNYGYVIAYTNQAGN